MWGVAGGQGLSPPVFGEQIPPSAAAVGRVGLGCVGEAFIPKRPPVGASSGAVQLIYD